MILKPSSCQGCPFYDKGAYFTPDTIVPGSEVMFIAQAPGEDEELGHRLVKRHWQGSMHHDEFVQQQPAPLLGTTGQLFNNRFLPLAGLQRQQVSLGNAIRCRPGLALGMKENDLPPLTTSMKLESSQADIARALRHCRDTHLHVPSSIKLIVAMGRYAMFSVTGIQSEEREYGRKQGVVESWRGYGVDVADFTKWSTIDTSKYHPFLTGKRVFFTQHLAALFRDKRYYHATLQDFHKVSLILQGKWPVQLPTWSTAVPNQWPRYSVFDTEYIPATGELTRWSLCDTEDNLYCIEADDIHHGGIPINSGSTIVIQNALADIGYLSTLVDMQRVSIEDMMLAHSVLWTGEPHSLNYIASMYGQYNRYKHLSTDNPQLYSALDAAEPMHIWKTHFLPEFKADLASWKIYKQYRMPLVNIINKAQQAGVRVDTNRLTQVQQILQQRLQEYQQAAINIIGDSTINLGSRKRIMKEIYE